VSFAGALFYISMLLLDSCVAPNVTQFGAKVRVLNSRCAKENMEGMILVQGRG
jgi:hypothetical protein